MSNGDRGRSGRTQLDLIQRFSCLSEKARQKPAVGLGSHICCRWNALPSTAPRLSSDVSGTVSQLSETYSVARLLKDPDVACEFVIALLGCWRSYAVLKGMILFSK